MMLVAASATMSAYDFEVDGIYYRIDDGNATVVNSTTSFMSYCGDIVIPDSVIHDDTTYIVTKIGLKAFYSCASLNSVTIPETVTIIGDRAFCNCKNLVSVNIPKSVVSIGQSAFSDCLKLDRVFITDLAAWCNTNIAIGANPLSYANHLFLNGEEIKDLVIPESVSVISNNAFYGFKGLTSLTISNGVISIKNSAFHGCTSLSSVTWGNTVESIADYAFAQCISLTNITFPNSVKAIEGEAFSQCENLTSLHIPKSVTSIGRRTFNLCSNLNSITVDSENQVYDSRDNCNAIIETSSNTLVFGCNNTVIPNSVTAIADYALQGMDELKDIIIPNSITSIGECAFNYCISLTSINIPSSIKSIGYHAFYACTGLSSVHITDLEAWCNIDFNSNPLTEAHHLILNGNEITDLVIPNSLNEIHALTFCGCQGLTSVIIPETINTLGMSAFNGCTNLTSISIPESISWIPNSAFMNCSRLASVELPNTISYIGNYAFSECNALTTINIPSSVNRIYNYAFANCEGLIGVVCQALTPPDVTYFFSNSNMSPYEQATLFVPNESLEAYRAHEEWGKFLHIVPFIGAGPGDINGDGSVAISDATNLIDMLLGGGQHQGRHYPHRQAAGRPVIEDSILTCG